MRYVKCGSEAFEFSLKSLPQKCFYCEEKALLKPEGVNLALCQSCFLRFCERRVRENISKHKMFSSQDRVGVFISGGKDSATLLAILKKLYPELNLQGIYLNLSIPYYSDQAEDAVRELCKLLEVPLSVFNLSTRDGLSIDDFIFTRFKNKICSVCGVIKRYYFAKLAKELNLTVIATGHHLDDTLSTMVSLFFNGDFQALSRLRPVLTPLHAGQVKKVKPLFNLPERDVFHYAVLTGLPLEGCGCPHGEVTPVKMWKTWLNERWKEDRSFKFKLLSVFQKKLLPLLPTSQSEMEKEFFPCERCGEPTPSKSKLCVKCRRCLLLEGLKNRKLEYSPQEFWEYYQAHLDEVVIFDVRERSDYESHTLSGALWLDPKLIEGSDRSLLRFFKPYRQKNLFFFCYTGRLSYNFTLRLRKLGFRAYNVKEAEYLLKSLP